MTEQGHALTAEEYSDFNDIVAETINRLVVCADKHNIDRDSFVRYFAAIFCAMAEISTFGHYGERSEGK
jgi:hypothetical protein